MKQLFYILLFGGLLFILTAVFLIHNSEGVRWYLIGQGQIMVAAGFMGAFLTRKRDKTGENSQ